MQAMDWQQQLETFLLELPSELRSTCQQNWQQYYLAAQLAHYSIPSSPSFLQALWRVLAVSDYATSVFVRFVDFPEKIQAAIQQRLTETWYEHASRVQDLTSLMYELRHYRQFHLTRILWRDVLKLDSFAEHLHALYHLADKVLEVASAILYDWLKNEWGEPQNEQGERQYFTIIALGKLGGRELNFSSDIDLMFTYPQTGFTVGKSRSIANEQFFNKLGQQLIKVLAEITTEGFVFRVDMRLRPHGQSGSLVLNYAALENYYQYQGRDWERYALIKARVVLPGKDDAEKLIALLQPFVYRRYLDYGAFSALREMKDLVNSEVKKRNKEHDLKLGRGGIRQIEFLVQAIQLIRGGREPQFREQNLLKAMALIAQAHYISETEYRQLREAYIFLRQTEHRIQMIHDEQIHAIPKSKIDSARLAYMMGFNDEKAFKIALKTHKKNVARQFNAVSSTPHLLTHNVSLSSPSQFKFLWTELEDRESGQGMLHKMGFEEAAAVWEQLRLFKDSRLIQSLKKQAMQRLDIVMPALLVLLAKEQNALLLLGRMLRLLRSIVRRSAYLALLIEKPQVLKYLINICGASEWVLVQICSYPILLDELLSPPSIMEMTGKENLQKMLRERLQWIAANDLEAQMEHLRQFKLGCFLSLAALELLSAQTIDIARALSDITEVLLEEVYQLSLTFMIEHYQIKESRAVIASQIPFGIIAYGKLGARELNYASDLDLVFLFDVKNPNFVLQGKTMLTAAEFSLRLAQRIIHMLNVPTATGVLYEVDVRLRPGGSAGLLVSQLQAYQNYLQSHAWTWEYQALVKARCIVGPEDICARFDICRQEALSLKRDPGQLAKDIQQMRTKMHEHRLPKQTDLKTIPGGIADIEFIAQFLVLKHAHDHPALLTARGTKALLVLLQENKFLTEETTSTLIEIYQTFQMHLRRHILKADPNETVETFSQQRAIVQHIWTTLFQEAS